MYLYQFRQVNFANGGSTLSASQFSPLPQGPLNMTHARKVVKIDSKIIISIPWSKSRYIKVKVEHYLLFMFNPPKISWVVSGIKYICLHLFTVFYLIQHSSKQIICFDFGKKIVCYLIVFYVPWSKSLKQTLVM